MTISGSMFEQIRDEYPDLNGEIRSILLSRAQEGATISQIKEDYYKLMGTQFPVYDQVVDFLLTIPSVSAVCSEQGTLYFNIVPTEKTRHLYDLVMQQKPQVESKSKSSYNYGQRLLSGAGDGGGNTIPLWRRDSNGSSNSNAYTNFSSYNNRNSNRYLVVPTLLQRPQVRQEQQQQPASLRPAREFPASNSDGNLSHCGSDEFVEHRSRYYEDNCNYLYNRLYNKNSGSTAIRRHTAAPSVHILPSNSQQQQLLYMANTRNGLDMYNSAVASHIQVPARSSSPTATRSSQYTESVYTSDSDYEAHLLDFLLLGDDFFLYLARMELKCKFRKYQKVLQSGLCMSGQNIGAAIKRIHQMPVMQKWVIVNIGSVDIMQGRSLVQIEHDLGELINVMQRKGLTPILTTLAPLANYAHVSQIKDRLERFNEFIKRLVKFNLVVIDIWSCLVNERRQTLYDCFQSEPRNVTGSSEPYVFWNKIGRQRVLQQIEAHLEY